MDLVTRVAEWMGNCTRPKLEEALGPPESYGVSTGTRGIQRVRSDGIQRRTECHGFTIIAATLTLSGY